MQVPVDEGQMVAEEDVIVVLEADGNEVTVLTSVPGVVRELYVARGTRLNSGTLVALIDEA